MTQSKTITVLPPAHIEKRKKGAYVHFASRVIERIGSDISADALWRNIIDDITNMDNIDRKLKFAGRLIEKNRRLWLTEVNGVEVGIVFDHSDNTPITVVTDFTIKYGYGRGSRYVRIEPNKT